MDLDRHIPYWVCIATLVILLILLCGVRVVPEIGQTVNRAINPDFGCTYGCHRMDCNGVI